MGRPEIINCAQGSAEWFAARRGIATASEFSTVLAKGEGKTRKTYMLKLAGEILTGEVADSYSNAHMERGKEMEDEARQIYAMQTEAELTQVGFVRNGRVGASPDSLIGEDGGVEIKTALPHILIDYLLRDEFPPTHRAQVQGTLMVTGRDWWDLVVYWPKLPPLIKRVTPDRDYIATLQGELDRFHDELDATVERVRRYGLAEAAAA